MIGRRRSQGPGRRAARIGLGLAALLACGVPLAGCGRNAPAPFLAPTGIRPRPEIGTAAVTGEIRYDPVNFPDLAEPPYPPTVVELLRDDRVVARDTVGGPTRTFLFRRLHAGSYTVVARAHLFLPQTTGPVRAVADLVDAGNLVLTVDPGRVPAAVYVSGDFNGFPDCPDYTRMDMNTLGVWTHPGINIEDPEGRLCPPLTLAPGTYRLRFATVSSDDTDYGSPGDGIVDVPVAHAPTQLVRGPNTDLRIRVAERGRFEFTLDERRQTFSVRAVAEPNSFLSRRTRQ